MNSITINCNTQAGQTIEVTTGTMVTIDGSYLELPYWFMSNMGSVPDYGVWMIETMTEPITISNPRPTYTLTYPEGFVKYYKDECPQTVNIRPGRWLIDGVVYEGTYLMNGDAVAEVAE